MPLRRGITEELIFASLSRGVDLGVQREIGRQEMGEVGTGYAKLLAGGKLLSTVNWQAGEEGRAMLHRS